MRIRPFRVITVVLLMALTLLLVLSVLQPGTFRLMVLQPARDLLFLQRELQPHSNFGDITTARLRPSRTFELPAATEHPHSVPLTVDLWLPEATPAPVALMLHGSSPRGRQIGFNMALAAALRDAGWIVMTPDARGFGDSGTPAVRDAPRAWHSEGDVLRLIERARSDPDGDGPVVVIGHSLGASHLVETDFRSDPPAAMVLIGPSRERPPFAPDLWQRIRYASDRKLAQPAAEAVLRDQMHRHDLMRFATAPDRRPPDVPILLMDGAREGDELIAVLAETAASIAPPVEHHTVVDSHHYCGVYQLPFFNQPVFMREDVFQRCLSAVMDFVVPVRGMP